MARKSWILIGLGALLAWASPCSSTSFLAEVVNPAGTGGTSLAFDSQGRPHVTYSLAGSLRHAVKSGDAWVAEVVPGVPGAGRRSLAIGAQDEPIVSYWDLWGHLHCVTRAGGAWTDEVVPTFMGGIGDALTVDAAGDPHILAYLGNGDLLHSFRSGGSWTSDVIASTGGQPTVDMCILIDSQGRTHVAAEQYYGRQVFYSPQQWVTEIVEETPSGVRPYHSVSLALDANDQPFVAFSDYATNSLKYAVKAGSDWNVAIIPGALFGLYTSLALDSGGAPHIMYSDGTLRYATRPGTDWTIESVATDGTNACMKLDAAGAPHVVYHGAGGVQYTRAIRCDLTFAPNPLNEHRQAPWVTAYLEPADFPVASVDPMSVRLAGSVSCDPKFATVGDKDGDGIADLMLKFRTDEVLPLLAGGTNSLAMTGRLLTGEQFETSGTLRLVGATNTLADLSLRIVSLPGSARVEYVLENPASGTARMQMFDIRGRLVRSWTDSPGQDAGAWDGTGANGRAVSSGVYFIRAESNGRCVSKRVVVSR